MSAVRVTMLIVSGTASPVRLPLRRPLVGRRLGGVCAGLAAHLDVPVARIRLAFIAASFVAGAGVVLYVWFWATVPAGDPAEAARSARAVSRGPLATRRTLVSTVPVTDVAVGVLLLAAAGLLLAWRAGVRPGAAWLLPVLAILAGLGLAWGQLDEVERGAFAGSGPRGRTPVVVVRVGAGVLLAALGVLLLVGQGQDTGDLVQGALAGLAVLMGMALVLAPLALRLWRQLGEERALRAREAERADIAAHLHDSVLQTLALIRSRAGEPDAVARLARAQERELRAWLYADRAPVGDSLVAAVREACAAIEDRYGVVVDVVAVGDQRPGSGTEVLLAAAREALTNAVVHGRAPVSLYVECGPGAVEIFVRDRGEGFDLSSVPTDRMGVRESIVGRMTRHGGEATVRRAVGGGTEVHLRAPATMLGPDRPAAAVDVAGPVTKGGP